MSGSAIQMTWPQYLRHECQIGAFIVPLSPIQTELLLLLMLRYPNPVTLSDMVEAAYPDPDREPDASHCCIYRHIKRLRARIGQYRIVGRSSFGWRLIQMPCQ